MGNVRRSVPLMLFSTRIHMYIICDQYILHRLKPIKYLTTLYLQYSVGHIHTVPKCAYVSTCTGTYIDA